MVTRFHRIARIGGLLFVSATLVGSLFAATPRIAPPKVVAVQVAPGSAWASAYLVETAERPFLVAQLSDRTAQTVPVVLLKVDDKGAVRAYLHTLVPASAVSRTGVVTVQLTQEFAAEPAATVELSDSYSILPATNLGGTNAPIGSMDAMSQCDCICCANLATRICSGGVKSFSCDGRTCTFSCK